MIKKIWGAVLLSIVSAVFLYGLYLQFAVNSKADAKITGQTNLPVIDFPSTACQANPGSCVVSLMGRRVIFSLPKKAGYLQRFPVTVLLQEFGKNKPEVVSVRFEMVGMEMGSNQVKLILKQGHWYADAMLPLCISGRSDWTAIVDINTGNAIYRASFKLVVIAKE